METPYVTVRGYRCVIFKFFDKYTGVSKEDGEVWPNDYIRASLQQTFRTVGI